MSKRRTTIVMLCLTAGLFVTLLLALSIGPVHISGGTVAKILLSKVFNIPQSWSCSAQEIVLNVRLPRILLGGLVGMALAVSGCAMQGLFRNPMASPYVCGVASGGAFGASLTILLGVSRSMIMPIAFSFAVFAIFLVYWLAKRRGKVPVETLLLAGIAISLFFSALTSFVQYIAKEGQLRDIVFWIMGGLWRSDWNKVATCSPIIILGTLGLFFFSRELNILLMGEEQAQDVGVNVENARKIVLVLTALTTAAAVAVCGIIGFVGLIIPHVTRIIVGPDHRVLLPSCCIAGGIFLVWVDTLARSLITPTEIPAGIITALIGVPFFLFLLRRRRRLSGF